MQTLGNQRVVPLVVESVSSARDESEQTQQDPDPQAEEDQNAAPGRTPEPTPSGWRGTLVDCGLIAFFCLLGGLLRLQQQYPQRFKVWVVLVVTLGGIWIGHYCLLVVPNYMEASKEDCTSNNDQMLQTARLQLGYFGWFAVTRWLLFYHCIAVRVMSVHSSTNTLCLIYCVHLLFRDGPIYVFVLASSLFWYQVSANGAMCQSVAPAYYTSLKVFGAYSSLVAFSSLILACWHHHILMGFYVEAMVRSQGGASRSRGCTGSHILSSLETVAFEEEKFGDEDGKQYPSECAICLCNWEAGETIRLTPCSHVFHEECLANWLAGARTCAICRRDLVEAFANVEPVPDPVPAVAWAASQEPTGSQVGRGSILSSFLNTIVNDSFSTRRYVSEDDTLVPIVPGEAGQQSTTQEQRPARRWRMRTREDLNGPRPEAVGASTAQRGSREDVAPVVEDV